MVKQSPHKAQKEVQFLPSALKTMIKKIKGKYVVLSENTGRKFGSYKTLAEAKKRLQQIEFFKHLKKKK